MTLFYYELYQGPDVSFRFHQDWRRIESSNTVGELNRGGLRNHVIWTHLRYQTIYPSTHPFINSTIHSSISDNKPFIHPVIHSSIQPSINTSQISNHLSPHSFIHKFNHPFIHPRYPTIYTYSHPFINLRYSIIYHSSHSFSTSVLLWRMHPQINRKLVLLIMCCFSRISI